MMDVLSKRGALERDNDKRKAEGAHKKQATRSTRIESEAEKEVKTETRHQVRDEDK